MEANTIKEKSTTGHNAEINRLWRVTMDTSILQLLHPWLREHFRKGEVERLSDPKKPKYQEVCCETVSPRNGCINMVSTTAAPTDIQKEGNLIGWVTALDKKLQATDD